MLQGVLAQFHDESSLADENPTLGTDLIVLVLMCFQSISRAE
jgi:hypothetical protein